METTIEEKHLCSLKVSVAVSKGLWPVKLCPNRILQFFTEGDIYATIKCSCSCIAVMLRSGLKKSFGYHLSGSFVRELEGIQGPTVQHRFSPETKQEGLAVASIV